MRHRYPSHVRHVVGDGIERRMPIHLVTARREERILLVRAGCGDVPGCDHPYAHALVAPGVDISRMMQGHLRVRGVQRADVDMIEAALAPQEHLVKWRIPR